MGHSRLRRDWINLEELIQTQCLAFAYLLKQKHIELAYHFHQDLPTFWGDPNRLCQILANLINNAFKYTPVGGHITVSADLNSKEDGQHIVIEVSDTGPGIAPEEQDRIFEVLYRSQQHRTKQRGLGLGLAIARRLAEAYKGTLTVDSCLGEGATFQLDLPPSDSPVQPIVKSPPVEVFA